MSAPVSFRLNGSPAQIDETGEAPFLFVLRNQLDLKATHFDCGLEQCGACVLSIDGQARYSCTLPVSALAGADVTTPEGLANDRVGAILLTSFEVEQAGQCGYCISGILMRLHALLKTERRPSRDMILAALDKHLCRCGAHGSILRAAERAVARLGEAV